MIGLPFVLIGCIVWPLEIGDKSMFLFGRPPLKHREPHKQLVPSVKPIGPPPMCPDPPKLQCEHNFVSRYTEGPIAYESVKTICTAFPGASVWELRLALSAAKSKNYEGEFCDKCGLFVTSRS